MQLFNFSLVLSGVDINTPDLENKLFESGCDDSLVCFYGSAVYVEFDRYATDFRSAILSAILNIESAGINAIVKSVDAGDYVGLSDISALTDISKQSIAMLKDGKRGAGNFPSPVQRMATKQPLWRWGEVSEWLASNSKIDIELSRNAATVEAFNLALELRSPKKSDEVTQIVTALSHMPSLQFQCS